DPPIVGGDARRDAEALRRSSRGAPRGPAGLRCRRARAGGARRLASSRRAPRASGARSPARGLRHPAGHAASAPGRGARPHRALAVDERPQPRRGLSAPAPPLPDVGRGARRAAARGGGGDPPGRDLARQVRPHTGDPAGAARSDLPRRPGHDAGAGRPGAAVRPARRRTQDGGVRAAVLLRDARRPGRHPRIARGHASRAPAPGSPVRGAPRRAAGDDAARPGARAARQPAAPRASHVPLPAARLRRVRPAAHVPQRAEL
ncbi:MAG: Endonuclease III, partial [uncultured Solirubrobacteraceae bacterium]